jgi:hypothetical protein
MQHKARSSYLNDEDAISQTLQQESALRNKTKFTDWLFSSLIYIILIPTLIYNAVWYFNLKSSLLLLTNEDWINENRIQGCGDVFNWVNYSLTWVIICFFKALFLLLCYSVCCSGENDCTMVCVMFKSLTSLLPSLIYIVKIPEYVKNYQVYSINAINLTGVDETLRASCDLMASTLFSYYRWEYSYMIFLLGVFCFILAVAACMCLKELWKGLNYHKED